MPFIKAFALGKVGVEHCDLLLAGGEAGFEMSNRLRSEGNFWNKDEHGFPLIQGVAGSL